ncbi:hypothetical protein D3C75_799490 [compost metagenome]
MAVFLGQSPDLAAQHDGGDILGHHERAKTDSLVTQKTSDALGELVIVTDPGRNHPKERKADERVFDHQWFRHHCPRELNVGAISYRQRRAVQKPTWRLRVTGRNYWHRISLLTNAFRRPWRTGGRIRKIEPARRASGELCAI